MFDAAPSSDHQPLQQSVEFERALRTFGSRFRRLSNGTLVLQRAFGPATLYMMTRPAARTAQDMLATVKSLGSKSPLIIAPDRLLPLHQIGALPLISPGTVAALDLTPDIATLRADLHQKWRNRLKYAEHQNLRIVRQNMPDDPHHWLFQAEARQQKNRGYRNWPTALTCGFSRENRGKAKLFTTLAGRTPIAAIVILCHGPGATYHIGYSGAAGRCASAHHLLLWEAICWARSKGIERLELGTINTEDSAGLARFKLGTGARTHRLGGTWIWWPPMTRLICPFARIDSELMRLS